MRKDNQLNGAINVGFATNRKGKVGKKDLEDLYRFNLSGRSSFGINLSKISRKAKVGIELYKLKRPLEEVRENVGNIDFSLLDSSDLRSNFQRIRSTKARNPKGAKITLNPLESGDYVIRIRQSGRLDSKYRLSTVGALIPEAPIPIPIPDPVPIPNPDPVPNPGPIPNPDPIPNPLPEGDNSSATARPVTLPFITQSDLVNASDTQDYYKFSVTNTSVGDYRFDLSNLTADVNVEIRNSADVVIKTATTSGAQTKSLLVPLDEGDYFARVFQNTPSAASNYSLSMTPLTDKFKGTFAAGDSGAELLMPEDDLTEVASNYVLDGAKGSKEDLFKIVIAQGERKFLNLELKGISGGSLTGNLDVELFGADGFTPTKDTFILPSSRPGNSAEVFGGTLGGGTYYIRIKPTGTFEGSEYSLSMSLDDRNGVPTITRDINYKKIPVLDGNSEPTGEETSLGSDAKLLTQVGGLAYFSANDGEGEGQALWRTDGTLKGTQKLRSFTFVNNFTEAGGLLYFGGNDGLSGTELWRSDGTVAGTQLVKDLTGGGNSNPDNLTAAGDRLYFRTGIDNKFYRTTESGTDVELISLPNVNQEPSFGVENLAFYDGTLYFSADNDAIGRELWKIEGAGTATPGTPTSQDLSSGSSNPEQFFMVNGKLYGAAVLASDDPHSLVKIDGNGNSAISIPRNPPSSNIFEEPEIFLAVGDNLYFSSNNSTDGTELWRLNTTTDQATLLSVAPGGMSSNPSNLVVVNNVVNNINKTSVYFFANGGGGTALWKVDDDSATPTKVDIRDESANEMGTAPKDLVSINNVLYFSATSTTKGRELWAYDAADDTPTMKLIDLNMEPDLEGGTLSSDPERLTNIGGSLYFIADNGIDGDELMSL